MGDIDSTTIAVNTPTDPMYKIRTGTGDEHAQCASPDIPLVQQFRIFNLIRILSVIKLLPIVKSGNNPLDLQVYRQNLSIFEYKND